MKKWLLLLVTGVLLLTCYGYGAAPLAEAEEAPEIAELHREVQLLNLLNGLELTADQMRFVLEKAQEAQELREKLKAEAGTEEVRQVLMELKDTLMRGENIPDSLKERWFSTHARTKELKKEYEEEMDRLAGEVEGILEGHQLYALEHFKPCIIPPEGGLRIGQAEGTGGLERHLERLRALPEEKFQEHKDDIVERVWERIKEHLPRGALLFVDEEEEKAYILSILEETRSLSDAEFEVRKEELAQEFKARYEPSEGAIDIRLRIRCHLLNPHIIPLLEEKLAMEGG